MEFDVISSVIRMAAEEQLPDQAIATAAANTNGNSNRNSN
jgi:hypothetical protein